MEKSVTVVVLCVVTPAFQYKRSLAKDGNRLKANTLRK